MRVVARGGGLIGKLRGSSPAFSKSSQVGTSRRLLLVPPLNCAGGANPVHAIREVLAITPHSNEFIVSQVIVVAYGGFVAGPLFQELNKFGNQTLVLMWKRGETFHNLLWRHVVNSLLY